MKATEKLFKATEITIIMVFKINIAEKTGKTYKLDLEGEALVGKELHEKIDGKLISPDLEGYEFEISGTSDNAGFTSMKEVEGIGLKKMFLKYGKAFKKRPKHEGKKKRSNTTPKGLKLRKTVRGKVISEDITQINLKILKEGAKKLSEVFPDQGNKEVKLNRAARRKQKASESKVASESVPSNEGKEKPVEEVKEEAPKEEVKSEEKKE